MSLFKFVNIVARVVLFVPFIAAITLYSIIYGDPVLAAKAQAMAVANKPKPRPPKCTPRGDVWCVIDSVCPMRLSTGISGPWLRQLTTHDKVTYVHEHEGDFYRVKDYTGSIGWVQKYCLQRSKK